MSVTADENSCFGKEYYDEDGTECPFQTCVARQECKRICDLGSGILHDRKIRQKKEEVESKNREKEKKKKSKKEELRILEKIKLGNSRKKGYDRPQKLDYKNDGCLRDDMVNRIDEYLIDTDYSMRRTRNIQSVSSRHLGPLNTEYLFKIETRRKKSILVYIRDDLANKLSDRGLVCRSLFDTEKACYPNYFQWVIQIKSVSELDIFLQELDL